MADYPGSIQLQTSEAYISALDLFKPQIDNQYYMQTIREDTICDYMDMMKHVAVAGPTFEHWESKRISPYMTAAANVADPGVDTSATIQLATSSHKDSGKYSFPQVNQMVLFLKNNSLAQITAVDKSTPNAHTITVHPYDATQTIGAISANDAFCVIGNAYAEATSQPGGYTPGVNKYQFSLQIMKATYEVSGSEYGDEIWFDFTDPNTGETGKFLYILGQENTVRLFKYNIELTSILSTPTTSTSLTGINTMQGAIPWIRNNGGVVENYVGGQWTYDKHKKFIKRFDKGMTPAKEYMYRAGIDFREECNNWLQDVMKMGGIQYGAFGGGEKGKEMGVQLGFDSFTDLGYSHHFSTYRPFNDGQMLGGPGSNYPGCCIVMPAGTTQDPMTKKQVPYARMRVKNSASYNREYKFWVTGVGPHANTNQTDSMQFNYLTHRGAEWFCPNQWGYINRVG